MTNIRYSLVLILFFVCCHPPSEELFIAQQFLKFLSQGEYSKAQRYVHPSSLPLIIDFENIGVASDTLQARPVPWRIDSILHQGDDSAWVYFTWNQLPEKILLLREKKHWKVIF